MGLLGKKGTAPISPQEQSHSTNPGLQTTSRGNARGLGDPFQLFPLSRKRCMCLTVGQDPGGRHLPRHVLIPHEPQHIRYLPWVLQGLASQRVRACQEHLGVQVYPSKTKNKSQDTLVCFSPSRTSGVLIRYKATKCVPLYLPKNEGLKSRGKQV